MYVNFLFDQKLVSFLNKNDPSRDPEFKVFFTAEDIAALNLSL